jgi:hypothetical protein
LIDNYSQAHLFLLNSEYNMQKKQVFVIGLILIGVIVLFLVLSVSLKKKEDPRLVFRKEIIANLKEGYSVKDTIFESLDGVNQQVVAIIHWEEKKGVGQQDSLVVYELKGKKLNEIFNTTEWVFELGNGLSGDYVRAEDINKDNLKEFVVTGRTGGNCWTCSYLRVFQVREHKVFELLSNLPETQIIYGIMDLDNNGIKELVVLDGEWEFYMELCHACSPSVDFVYTWNDNRYQDESNEFPLYYEEKIKRIEKEIEEMSAEDRGSDYYIGRVVSIFLDYVKIGEKKKGWKIFKDYMAEENFRDKSFKNMAESVTKDLERRFLIK